MSDALNTPEDHPDGINPSLEDNKVRSSFDAAAQVLLDKYGTFVPDKLQRMGADVVEVHAAEIIQELLRRGYRDASSSPETEHVETANDHLVGSTGMSHIVMLAPPFAPIPYEEALRMAAWIVLIADSGGERFEKILQAIKSA